MKQPTMTRRPSGGLGFDRDPLRNTEAPLPDWVRPIERVPLPWYHRPALLLIGVAVALVWGAILGIVGHAVWVRL